MRLFSKIEADKERKKQTQELVEKNHRLIRFFEKGLKKLNDIKDNYSQEKVKAEKEHADFVNKLMLKKSEMLKELYLVEKEIEEKKDILFSLAEKQDELMEREYKIVEREKVIDLRTDFVEGIERKINSLTNYHSNLHGSEK